MFLQRCSKSKCQIFIFSKGYFGNYFVFDKADEFYKQNFEEDNLNYLREIEPGYDIKIQRAEENSLKRDLERQQLEKDNNDEDSDYEFEKSYKKQ